MNTSTNIVKIVWIELELIFLPVAVVDVPHVYKCTCISVTLLSKSFLVPQHFGGHWRHCWADSQRWNVLVAQPVLAEFGGRCQKVRLRLLECDTRCLIPFPLVPVSSEELKMRQELILGKLAVQNRLQFFSFLLFFTMPFQQFCSFWNK